jgi:O-antigen ligase
MLAAAQVFADHPIIGVGTGMFGYYYQDYAKYLGPRWQAGERRAHDLYVGLLAENGLLGFIAFMALIVMTISLLAKARKELLDKSPLFAALATGFIFSIATYLGTGIGLHFGYYRFFWLIMALAYAASQVATVYPLEEELTKTKIAIKASLHPILEQESDSMT